MKVHFDDQIFLSQTWGGISAYFANIIREFDGAPDLGVEPIGFPILSPNVYLSELRLGRPIRNRLLPKRRKMYVALNTVRRLVSRRLDFDIAHPTFYFNAPPARGRLVVTVHDMTPEMFPDLIRGRDPHFRKSEHIRAADAIACVSTTTARDLKRLHPEVQVPVVVTPLAVGAAFHPWTVGDRGRPYILFVGTRTHTYKHFSVFLQAAAELTKRVDRFDVVVAGGGPLSDADRAEVRRCGLESRTRHVSPSDEELSRLYASAAAFVFPSAYEGFGLPVLEAMASGCPVVASDASALVEVAGGAALHVPAGDSEALAAALERVLDDEALAAELRTRGFARAAASKWADTARATRDCYRLALQ